MCHVDSERNFGTWGVGWLHFSILALPSFSSTFCKELWTLCIGWCFLKILYLPSFFKHFLQGIKGLRCSMVAFVYLIFILFLSNFWKELRTSGIGCLHGSILSPPFFFEPVLQGIKDLKCRMITFFNLISTSFFKHFLPGIIGLRFRMVTFFYLSFTLFFKHFLQRTMDLWLHPHKDTSQTVYKLRADI